ncbi:hypothetical protein OOJ91_22305 [Micromonospora lupini]|uniref:hypothetical protein n=1 Tax=Micromonospora lupini TaxID=285679 RepID=UPI00225883BE|nr:hypothetical protein [Micromonospora lupini]MCX5068576.1 hypothetical protein [Micromonospora lupini]
MPAWETSRSTRARRRTTTRCYDHDGQRLDRATTYTLAAYLTAAGDAHSDEHSAESAEGDRYARPELRSGSVRCLISPGRGENESTHLVVLDVLVNLRAIDPIGTSQVWAARTPIQG